MAALSDAMHPSSPVRRLYTLRPGSPSAYDGLLIHTILIINMLLEFWRRGRPPEPGFHPHPEAPQSSFNSLINIRFKALDVPRRSAHTSQNCDNGSDSKVPRETPQAALRHLRQHRQRSRPLRRRTRRAVGRGGRRGGHVETVPPERMKAKLEHRVPLSERAVAVLDEARELSDKSGLVFPTPTGRVLSDSTLSKLLRELGIGVVPHGFRSSFRDWAAERTDVPRRARSANSRWRTSTMIAWRPPPGAAICSKVAVNSCTSGPTTCLPATDCAPVPPSQRAAMGPGA